MREHISHPIVTCVVRLGTSFIRRYMELFWLKIRRNLVQKTTSEVDFHWNAQQKTMQRYQRCEGRVEKGDSTQVSTNPGCNSK